MSDGSPKTVGWIGVGKLGGPMVGRLAEAGFDPVVYDANPDARTALAKLYRVANSVADVAANADLVFSTIPDDTVLHAVAIGPDGVLDTLKDGGVYVDMSTVSPGASASVAEVAAARRVRYLRAPVSGSVMHAEKGILTVLASGPEDAFAEATPVFEAFSAARFHVGAGEEARYLKLVINNLVGSTATLVAESLALGRKGGLDWETMLDVIAASAAASLLIQYKTGPLKARDFTPAFTTRQMIKDVGLVTQAAADTGCETPLAKATLALFEEQAAAGMADDDFFSAVRLLERKAGLGEP